MNRIFHGRDIAIPIAVDPEKEARKGLFSLRVAGS